MNRKSAAVVRHGKEKLTSPKFDFDMPTPVYCGVRGCDFYGHKKELIEHKKLKHSY